ncbi:APG12-domain-containing protein [Acaromyces ingoldii]|uniref:Ubiquitin-like protein ATG12 n=1 Tax=Acaromyces ingoldii TaxID=215250 RepID=A0A316YZM8_9BASI|nr:APG12-domain-containing protein [Acaromyces ingoldii]PWN93493.1 APG12-domain-containing protein [Acaromyces ingoldii]
MSESASPVPAPSAAAGSALSAGNGGSPSVITSAIGTPSLSTAASNNHGSGVASPPPSSGHRHPYSAASLSALEVYKKRDPSKIVIRFKAIGSAPQMKNNYFRITSFNRFQAVIQFLRKELGMKQSDALFTYINSSFSPAPDDSVGNLFRCFGTEGHLIVNYSLQAAWG